MNRLAVRRPQNPIEPFPYREESVSFSNFAAKVDLAGTLTLPKGSGPFPSVILIAGSGPHDRDESLAGHRPFLIIADALTRRDIAVLRYDKRGIGGSTGSVDNSTTLDFAGDTQAAINYLKSRKEIDVKKIGLLGHSEGAMIAPYRRQSFTRCGVDRSARSSCDGGRRDTDQSIQSNWPGGWTL